MDQKKKKILDHTQILNIKLDELKKTRKVEEIQETLNLLQLKPNNYQNILENEQEKAAKQIVFSPEVSDVINTLEEQVDVIQKEKYKKEFINQLLGDRKKDNEKLIKMARIYYDVGKYDSALHLLNCVHFVAGEEQLHLSYMWGKLNCELILGCFDESRDTLKSLKNKLDADHLFGGTHSFYQVYSRTQYIHALLYFVYFNDKSVDSDFDMFMEIVGSENYFAVIQMVAPYFIRYLISSPLLSRNYFTYGTYGVNWLLNALQQNVCDYSDSIVEFIRLMLIDFDFAQSEQQLKEIAPILQKDVFLASRANQILDKLQQLFFETYSKIHGVIEIKMVSSFLGVSIEEAEIWIVNVIRTANIDAKIDSEKEIIFITRKAPAFTEIINTKMRDIVPRTNLLVNNLKRILKKD